MDAIIKWLESHMATCFYKKYFGMDCPGCGMQRAFIQLLKGNIWESLKLYPALLPTIFLVIYLILHIIFDFKKGASVVKYSFILTAIIVMINYFAKQIIYGIH
jgi:hypothetical protein